MIDRIKAKARDPMRFKPIAALNHEHIAHARRRPGVTHIFIRPVKGGECTIQGLITIRGAGYVDLSYIPVRWPRLSPEMHRLLRYARMLIGCLAHEVWNIDLFHGFSFLGKAAFNA